MRALFVCAFLAGLSAAPAPSHSQEAPIAPLPESEVLPQPLPPLSEPSAPASGDDEAASALDGLFAELRRERSPEAAERLAGRIEAHWLDSGSATVDLLMGWADAAAATQNEGAAFDLLEQVMVLSPDYAEAWNRRATLNYGLDRYGRSLADIEQTLIREPRHFGALMGLGAILETLGRDSDAAQAYGRVLEVYPSLRAAQDALARLSDAAEGRTL
ncbi:hypothetical protein [Aureimonas populi]|uniref:Tetratricopeptide repeat protein n=1 Tax=Aureimonas populi TaxID=1701758 RepID=A0ABW5CJK9_9HYPH|nr:hypothetical protein [Aureimonas populi]